MFENIQIRCICNCKSLVALCLVDVKRYRRLNEYIFVQFLWNEENEVTALPNGAQLVSYLFVRLRTEKAAE